jgi:hypothetical protein
MIEVGDFAQPLPRLLAVLLRPGKFGRVDTAANQRRLGRIHRPVIIETTLGQPPFLAAAPILARDRLVGPTAVKLAPVTTLAAIALNKAGHAISWPTAALPVLDRCD